MAVLMVVTLLQILTNSGDVADDEEEDSDNDDDAGEFLVGSSRFK